MPQHNPLGYARPPAAAPPRRSRSGLWTTAIVVAVLVILCSGVISFLYRKYGDTAAAPASVSVTSGAVRAYGGDYPARTSYRREVRLLPAGGGTTTSEGRETR